MSTDLRPRGSGSLSGGERNTGRIRPPVHPQSEAQGAGKNVSAAPPKIAPATSAVAPTFTMPKLSPAELNTAMVHFYRGEVQRANTWRNRLDTTTNWAVITAGATLSFVFSSTTNPHFVIPLNSALVAFFLFMEARRYRYYEIWSSRVRVIETGYFAQLLSPQNAVDHEWAGHLAADLLTPHFTISEWEAVGRRLRRNYLWIFILLAISWNIKVYLHPHPAHDMDEFIARAAVGFVPGWFIIFVGILFNTVLLVFAIATVRLREATGEVLPRHEFSLRSIGRVTGLARVTTASSHNTRRAKRARQRVRTGSTATTTGEFKRIDITETPDKKQKPEARSQKPEEEQALR
jgi:uncharacterized membrane protein